MKTVCSIVCSLCLIAFCLPACSFGGDGSDLCDGVDCSGHGTCSIDNYEAACSCDSGFRATGLHCMEIMEGTATALTADLHDGPSEVSSISLRDMETGYEVDNPDFYIVEVDEMPIINLADGVEAMNMGEQRDFHDWNEAPETGYESDGEEPVIGSSFVEGGGCHTGWILYENVYILKLADGTFAKFEILSGGTGLFELICYRQEDGSRNLATVR